MGFKHNKISNLNIMNKKILTNLKFLEALGRNVKGEAKAKVDTILDLYKTRQISQVDTAEKAIIKLKSATKKEQNKAFKFADKLINKHQEAQTLSHRLRQKTTVRIENQVIKNIDVGDDKKAKTDIKINLNSAERQDGKHAIWDYVFKTVKPKMIQETERMLNIKKQMKIQTIVYYRIKKPIQQIEDDKLSQGEYKIENKIGWKYRDVFNNTHADSVSSNTISDVLAKQAKKIQQQIDHTNDSWQVDTFYHVIVSCYTIKQPRAASYIPTPAPYNNAKCGLVNIQNKDNKCFQWCMKYHQSKQIKHDDRISILSKIEDKYNYENVSYPASQDDIKAFEDNNKVCINVYVIGDNSSILLEYMGNIQYIKNDIIYLLRIESDDISHYVYIKHIQRLLNLNSYTKPGEHREFCPYCNKNVKVNDFFDNHLRDCYKRACGEGSLIKLPEEGSTMKFKNHKNKLERPYIVYADCESTLEKVDIKLGDNTSLLHKHKVNSCCFYFVCTFDSSRNKLETFEGENCIEDMVIKLHELSTECIEEMKHNQEMTLSQTDKKKFYSATHCSICNERFETDEQKCRDHDHRTGQFRGATHSKCNVNYFCNRYLPVVFHNLRGYDSHLIIKKAYDISSKLNNPKFDVIPNSYEKFMSFNIGSLKFIDSFQFMASSLEKLVVNLFDENDKYVNFNNMKQYYNNEIDLLCQKGFYPYEWVDTDDKLNYVGIPPIESFYSTLSQETISAKNYLHAQNVYNKLNCKSFRDYHMTYLKCDVLLLADVFENFRTTCFNYYGLDPANYISAPSLAWDAMLMKTKIELEQIHDVKILDIIERHKRGGLCFVGSKRHVKANNHYLEDFDATKPENYLMYWDANNLYGWAMSQYLPYKNISLNNEIDIDTILKTDDNSKVGYIVECDLEFPQEIHDKLKEFPPCPESVAPKLEWLSDVQKAMLKKEQDSVRQTDKDSPLKTSNCSKLVPHLMKHEKYCIHYRNLKFVEKLGVKIGIVHNVVQFKQKPWLKKYIDFNTDKRKEAKNEFEKDFFKLMNNAVFGKTMENVKNRINLHLTTDETNAIKWFSKINFKTSKNFDNLHLIEMYKQEIIYDKPIYVGTSILDLSKLHMMNFHYNVINKEFEGKHNLIYSDTDSFVYNIEHPDIYKWIHENKHHFDLSDSLNNNIKDNQNKKVLGMFKDELCSIPMKEFTALNPKVYSFESAHECSKKLKGISKVVVKKEITHADYNNVLETGKKLNRDVVSIRSFEHQLYTVKTNKTALTAYYDKMFMNDKNTCSPFGYYKNNI